MNVQVSVLQAHVRIWAFLPARQVKSERFVERQNIIEVLAGQNRDRSLINPCTLPIRFAWLRGPRSPRPEALVVLPARWPGRVAGVAANHVHGRNDAPGAVRLRP